MKLFINAKRNGYTPDQAGRTMTVAELIAALEEFPEDAQVFLKYDGGYTFGSITPFDLEDGTVAEEEEEG